MKAKTALFLACVLGLGGAPALAADQADFDKAYAAAEAARKKAASVSGEWRDTAKIMKKAQKRAEAGDFKAAVRLAEKAEHQGHQGYEQMTTQAGKVGPEPYLQ